MADLRYRPLHVYAFDPSQGRSLGNFMTMNVPYEELAPGPQGPYLAVIDYDATNDCYYTPVNLNDAEVLLGGGLAPSEADPRFHQQMVYAVARHTIRIFEQALGRRVTWGFRRTKDVPVEQHRLRLFPHAMQEANAYYARDLRGIAFGYFRASDEATGSNLQGQTVFTCLSHDIIAHEMTHALVDGQRRLFMDNTNPDVPAFHEAFADIVALLQHFSLEEALLHTIQRTGGLIHRQVLRSAFGDATESDATISAELSEGNPLVDLARQFGESMGMRAALRSALGTKPNSTALQSTFEPHERGAILVAAVFDAYFTTFLKKTADLFRIAGISTSRSAATDIHPDLARRLAGEAAKLARHFCTMCIRALDYCPPLDITFGDFLRALITSDGDMFADDKHEYRESLIQGFRLRGIRPRDVASLSEESLRWNRPEKEPPPCCNGLNFDLLHETGRDILQENAANLVQFAKANAAELHLSPNVAPQAQSFHPVSRPSEGRPRFEIIAELVQQRVEPLDLKDANSPKFKFRGGSTVVFDQDGNVRYVIRKSIEDGERLQRQRDYLQQYRSGLAGLTFGMDSMLQTGGALNTELNFNLVHRGI